MGTIWNNTYVNWVYTHKKMAKKKILSWKWIKENFWNVLAIMLIWQIIFAVIFSIIGMFIPLPAVA
jgi:hypothetical protein